MNNTEDKALKELERSDTEGGVNEDALLDEILKDTLSLSAEIGNQKELLETNEEEVSNRVNYEATYTQTNAPPHTEQPPIISQPVQEEKVALQILVPQDAWNEMSPQLEKVGYNTESPAHLFQDMLKKHALNKIGYQPSFFPEKEKKPSMMNPYIKYGLIIIGGIAIIGLLWVFLSKKGAAQAVVNKVKDTAKVAVETAETVVETVKDTAQQVKHRLPI